MVKVAPPDAELLLELLNTTPTVDGSATDLLARPDQAVAWLKAHAGSDWAEQDLAYLRDTRDLLQGLVRGSGEIYSLSDRLKDVRYEPVVTREGLIWEIRAPVGQLLAVRLIVAWDALQDGSSRLRHCENADECSLFLLDRSKSNTARWCSMAGCGNRMKARRHYERSRGGQSRSS